MKKQSSKAERVLESAFLNFRYIVLFVVIILLLSSILAFILGARSFWSAFSASLLPTKYSSSTILVYLISAIDEFLLGVVMIIMALGLYELFISKLDALEGDEKPYLNWLKFTTLEDLKGVLTKIIIILLMVYFFKSAVVMHFDTPQSILYLGAGIIMIAIAGFISKPFSFNKH